MFSLKDAHLIQYPSIPVVPTGVVIDLWGHRAFEVRLDGSGEIVKVCMGYLDYRRNSPVMPAPSTFAFKPRRRGA